MIGWHAVQIGITVAAVVLVFSRLALPEGIDPASAGPTGLINAWMSSFRRHAVGILGVAQAGTIVYGLLAIRLRRGPHGLRQLGWQRPWVRHWLLVGLLVPPLWLLCSVIQHTLFQLLPGSRADMQALMQSLSHAPLWLLVLVIGVGPALGEELVFRGLIGRGLVARGGLFKGMAFTSILFGVMHINPAQIGVIPLGLAMHFVYVTTRSFWAPVTLHLFNNSLSVILLKYGNCATVGTPVENEVALPIHLLVVSAVMVAGIAIWLWQTRVQYVLPDGSLWNPGCTSTELLPPQVTAIPIRQSAETLRLAGSRFTSFAAAVWRLKAG
jgi:membrane protease YdiL (CAAX protease family)